VTVLVSEVPERGVLIVTTTTDAAGNDTLALTSLYLAESLRIAYFPGFQRTEAGALLGPRWFAACPGWTAAHHPMLADLAKKHLRVAGLSDEMSVTREEIVGVIRDRIHVERPDSSAVDGGRAVLQADPLPRGRARVGVGTVWRVPKWRRPSWRWHIHNSYSGDEGAGPSVGIHDGGSRVGIKRLAGARSGAKLAVRIIAEREWPPPRWPTGSPRRTTLHAL